MTVLTVEPNPLSVGGTATVCVEGAAANATVTVEVDDGKTPPHTDTIQIQTDGDGNGCEDWTVPNWGWANFNTHGATEISRLIE